MFPFLRLVSGLTDPAKKAAPATLDKALYRVGANRAGLTFAPVNIEIMLKIAELAICIGEIAQRTTSGFYGLGQNGLDVPRKSVCFCDFESPCGAARRDACSEQGLTDIYIAETGDYSLIQ